MCLINNQRWNQKKKLLQIKTKLNNIPAGKILLLHIFENGMTAFQ